jgi:hypothetical protein
MLLRRQLQGFVMLPIMYLSTQRLDPAGRRLDVLQDYNLAPEVESDDKVL